MLWFYSPTLLFWSLEQGFELLEEIFIEIVLHLPSFIEKLVVHLYVRSCFPAQCFVWTYMPRCWNG